MPKLANAIKASRRAEILAAALTCFARTGYHATTMADVAEAAEVSKGTPYLYFPSKEALFVALYDEWDCSLGERIGDEIGTQVGQERPSPRRTLLAVAEAVGAHVVEHSDSCRVLMEARTLAGYYPLVLAAVEQSDQRSWQQLRGLFEAGVAAGEWSSTTSPEVAARVFTAGLYGLMAQWHMAPHSFSWEAAALALVGEEQRVADPT